MASCNEQPPVVLILSAVVVTKILAASALRTARATISKRREASAGHRHFRLDCKANRFMASSFSCRGNTACRQPATPTLLGYSTWFIILRPQGLPVSSWQTVHVV